MAFGVPHIWFTATAEYSEGAVATHWTLANYHIRSFASFDQDAVGPRLAKRIEHRTKKYFYQ